MIARSPLRLGARIDHIATIGGAGTTAPLRVDRRQVSEVAAHRALGA